ncbi:MAG: hypothetical protein R2712_31080 [Vicinamibacterales bacterium]
MVVTASKVEQQIVNAPATVSVVSSDTIQRSSPINNYAELLREVPGRTSPRLRRATTTSPCVARCPRWPPRSSRCSTAAASI